MTTTDQPLLTAQTFFDRYAQALLGRDAGAIAHLYSVPALIDFPDNVIAVTDRTRTEQFFEQAFGQYADVTRADAHVTVTASGPHSIWADVTWDHHGGAPDERNMYLLTRHDDTWRIAALTPLEVPPPAADPGGAPA